MSVPKISRLLGSTAFVAAVVFAFQAQANCSAPLPANVKVDAPSAGLPAGETKFLGIWEGTWTFGPCAKLAVRSISPDGTAAVTYAFSSFSISRGSLPPIPVAASSHDYSAKVQGDTLIFTTERGSPVTLKLDGDKLDASLPSQSGWNGSYIYTATFTKQ
jgi:hypothetical protein